MAGVVVSVYILNNTSFQISVNNKLFLIQAQVQHSCGEGLVATINLSV